MAPWGLALLEAVVMTLLYWILFSSDKPWRHSKEFHYSFSCSLEDIVLLSYLRFLAVLLAYLLGAGQRMMRPYWYTAVFFAAASLPFSAAKSIFMFPTKQWLPPAALLSASLFFTVAHLATARNMVKWARRRAQMGLLGFGYPWEEGEEAWMLLRQKSRHTDLESQQLLRDIDEDPHGVTPSDVADEDSCFFTMGTMQIHYKVARSQGRHERWPGACILLVHPFGGGVFSWRHIMQPLADACQCPVVAFDRPGFGLTSRPSVTQGTNPYTLEHAAEAAVQLCLALGFTKMIFAGHADGAVVGLVAVANLSQHMQREEEALSQGYQGGKPEAQAIGMILLHPMSMDEGEVGSPFSRLLGSSRLGRRMLVRMMRTEVGEVSNRGAWADPSLATPEIMDLYKAPLRMQGWDAAIMEVTRAPKLGRCRMQRYLQKAEHLSGLIITGAQDRISTPHITANLSSALPASQCIVLEAVGHLSHEERPDSLIHCLSVFCIEVLEFAFGSDGTES
ncbi:hypothetical protein WJX75_008214 [Coccomyxa subellipsoidea]|uniref:AB hydrolase-1 domain-containing protein n=1 Tax=Coccomyxa subellipsoidea TaxID=248742 RepID=A0ABR2YNE1_9CHLO